MASSSDVVIGYCNYCKGEISCLETYISRDGKLYHAEENEVHDNCFKLVFEYEDEN